MKDRYVPKEVTRKNTAKKVVFTFLLILLIVIMAISAYGLLYNVIQTIYSFFSIKGLSVHEGNILSYDKLNKITEIFVNCFKDRWTANILFRISTAAMIAATTALYFCIKGLRNIKERIRKRIVAVAEEDTEEDEKEELLGWKKAK